MEKKVYKTPAIESFQMTSEDGLLTLSANAEGIQAAGDTSEGNVRSADTKSEGQWDDFWDSLVN
jgi:hypothetical protein